jgi:ribose/xylose/arabinose/galactoside ABC-type transport system permease subunit
VTANLEKLLRRSIMEGILVLLCVGLALTAPNFLTAENFFNILRSTAMLGIIAFGMTMVIVCGEIDLSVGSLAALSGCLAAFLVEAGSPVFAAIMLTLAAGFVSGAFTGLMRVRYNVPSFITSLALLAGLRGLAFLITGGFPITPFPAWYNFLGGGYLLGVPFPAIVLIAVFAFVHFLMAYTTFGRSIYAVGGNAEAARLSGIRVGRVRILALGCTGLLAALSGVMLSARIMSGTPTVAQGLELDVIAAVVIGGTSLMGGVGTIWGTLVGVIFIGVIINGMTLLNVPVYSQYVVRGALILVAVLINQFSRKKG